MKTNFTFLLFSIAVLISTNLSGQVTIGSDKAPIAGGLLDIKENTSAGANANGGLGLPRVNLTDKSNLFPMFTGDTNYENNTDQKKDTEDALHTGLVVYNLNTDLCEDIYPGVQVWDGKEWIPLGKGTFPGETDILIDKRNPSKTEQYQIGKFGNAGWWMLENLRAEKWPDGSDGVFKEPGKYRPVYNTRYYEPMFWYPKLDKNFMSSHPEYGYIYNGWAALRTTWDEMKAAKPTTGIQGICPDGWHVPTLAEWAELADVVYQNPCQYAHSRINANIDYNMMSMGEAPDARSRSREQGGFNAHLLGYVTNSGTINPTPDYDYVGKTDPSTYPEYLQRVVLANQAGIFWASDTTRDELVPSNGNVLENLWGFASYIDGTINSSKFASITYSAQLPIRCKKNDTTRSKSSSTDISDKPLIILE